MLSNLRELAEIDILGWLIATIVFILIWKGGAELKDWFCNRYGIETKKMKEKREDHDLLIKTAQNLALLQEKSEKDDRALEVSFEVFVNEVREAFEQVHKKFEETNEMQLKRREQSLIIQQELNNKIDDICNVLDEMKKNTNERFAQSEEKTNKRVQSDIKERIAQSYRHYNNCKKISHMELEALEDLIDTYESFGGKNSFVHSVVQKEMYTWEITE